MKKLILFVHGLGGSDETWGKFKTLLKEDSAFNNIYCANSSRVK